MIPRHDDDLRAAARQYALHGMPIFPVLGKKPHPLYAPHGFKNATVDVAEIDRWFSNGVMPTGIALEPATRGFAVIDIDSRHSGFDSIALLEARLGILPDTRTVLTPGYGEHRYFDLADGVVVQSRNGAFGDGFPGVDVKSRGGYVVLPPSTHPNGGAYRWDAADATVATIPEPWLALLRPQTTTPHKVARGFVLPERIAEGRRRDLLFRFACSQRNLGLCADELLATLLAINKGRCNPPLDERELADIASDVARRYEPTCDAFAGAGDEWPPMGKVEPIVNRAPSMSPDLLPEASARWSPTRRSA